jgi:hypothetical protein
VHVSTAADRRDIVAQRDYFPGVLNANERHIHAALPSIEVVTSTSLYSYPSRNCRTLKRFFGI